MDNRQITRPYRIRKIPVAAACFCIVIGGIIIWYILQVYPDSTDSTLIGATKIYPTVMVNQELYEWHKGVAICEELPEDSLLYGNIRHTTKETPQNDCEFASVFGAEGQIYTVPDKNCIYLKLTTSWLNDTIIRFNRVKNGDSGKLLSAVCLRK